MESRTDKINQQIDRIEEHRSESYDALDTFGIDCPKEEELMASLPAMIRMIQAEVCTSFNGRKGHVLPEAGDYTPAMVGAAPASHTHTVSETGGITPAQVDAKISTAIGNLINGAPDTLDTLKELADAIKAHQSVTDALNTAIAQRVPMTRTINGKALSADITLSAANVGAAPTSHTHTASQISGPRTAVPYTTPGSINLDTTLDGCMLVCQSDLPGINFGGNYAYVIQMTYRSVDASESRLQVAFPYISGETPAGSSMGFRTYYNGTWSSWKRVITEKSRVKASYEVTSDAAAITALKSVYNAMSDRSIEHVVIVYMSSASESIGTGGAYLASIYRADAGYGSIIARAYASVSAGRPGMYSMNIYGGVWATKWTNLYTQIPLATVAPKVAGTAAVGTSTRVAREDHVHPAQSSVSGTAGSLAFKIIAANTDMNTLTADGWYRCDNNVTVKTLKNCPTDYAFSMEVLNNAAVMQRVTTYTPNNFSIYVRNYYNGTWGAWNKVYTAADKPTPAQIGALPSKLTETTIASKSSFDTFRTNTYAAMANNEVYRCVIKTTSTMDDILAGTYVLELYKTAADNFVKLINVSTGSVMIFDESRISGAWPKRLENRLFSKWDKPRVSDVITDSSVGPFNTISEFNNWANAICGVQRTSDAYNYQLAYHVTLTGTASPDPLCTKYLCNFYFMGLNGYIELTAVSTRHPFPRKYYRTIENGAIADGSVDWVTFSPCDHISPKSTITKIMTYQVAGSDLAGFILSLPKLIPYGGITIVVTETCADNIHIKGFYGGGELTIRAESGIQITGSINVFDCSAAIHLQVNMQRSNRGYTGISIRCCDRVRISASEITWDTTNSNGIAIEIQDSHVWIGGTVNIAKFYKGFSVENSIVQCSGSILYGSNVTVPWFASRSLIIGSKANLGNLTPNITSNSLIVGN